MAEYQGLYTFPYNGGLFAIPFYHISGAYDTVTDNLGDVRECSIVSIRSSGVWRNTGVLNLSNTLTINPISNNAGFYIRDSGNSVYSTVPGTGDNVCILLLGFDGTRYYLVSQVRSTTSRGYSSEWDDPTSGKAGYIIITYDNDGGYGYGIWDAISNTNLINFLTDNLKPFRPADPYSQGGESETGGGEGNFDGTSVDVDFTSLPTLSAVDTGFITLYNPTVAQLQALASYMWSGAFDLDTFKKLFADPMQAILGLSIVPGPVPSSGGQAVKVGNISTGINMTNAASQYIDVDCGTLNVEEFWGAYLDYEPYTKAEIYLPYIGTHQIAVDDIMGKAVHIKYHIDILSGACAAEIKCGGSVLYTFIGSVAVSIPVTGNDWTNVINGVLSIAGAVGSLVATGGAAAPAAAGEIASAAVNSLKPNIEKSGAVSGGGGLMAGKVPVLILTRPRQALPASQNTYTGYPAFITRSLGAVSGYTEVHKIRLGGISATDAELDEIENLLKGGVIL